MEGSQEVLFGVFSLIALGTACGVALSSSRRATALLLWSTGMAVGAVYLVAGAEFLAVLQWLLAILIGLIVVFYSVLFEKPDARPRGWAEWSYVGVFLLVFAALLSSEILGGFNPFSAIEGSQSVDLHAIGRELVYRHTLAIEVLAVTVFLSVVGVGVISRAEKKQK